MFKRFIILITILVKISFIHAQVSVDQVQGLYDQAMIRAGGIKDMYTASEIKKFNETFLPLISMDSIPSHAMMMIPGTQARFIVNFLNDLKTDSNEFQSEVMISACSENQGTITELAPMSEETKDQILSLQSEMIPLNQTTPNQDISDIITGSIWPDYEVSLAATDSTYITDIKDSQGQVIPFANKIIDCEDCPSYVAAVSLLESDMQTTEHCSGSLVEFAEKQYFYTNRHCLPQDIKDDFNQGINEIDCRSRIQLTFPANKRRNQKRELAQCTKVVAISDTPLDMAGPPDWAIFEITPVQRDAADLQTRDLIKGEKMTLFPMYPVEKGEEENKQEMRLDQGGQERWYSIFTSKKVECQQLRVTGIIGSKQCDQEITPGNSGSGAFHEGSLAGVLSHIVPVGMTNEEYVQLVQEGKRLWSPAFMGTTTRDILKDIYIAQKEDPNYRVYPMDELDKVFPELKEIQVTP